MSLIKFIIFSLIAYLVLRMVRRLIDGPVTARLGANRDGRRKQPVSARQSSQTVRCEVCGTFVAEKSALVAGNRSYCSKVCAESRLRKA